MKFNKEFNSEAIDAAIEKGIGYLLSCNSNGKWKGFPTLAGESDIWVTGFVLSHIAAFCQQTTIIREAEKFLLQSQHADGGWSYSSQVPSDADSTAWCLQALQPSNDFTEPDKETATTFLWSHFTNGGVSTYRVDSGIREFISAPADEFIAGWTSPHPDVSIAAALADTQNDKAAEIINWLIQQQTSKGFINSYWWLGPHYTTALFLRAASKIKYPVSNELAGQIVESLVREQLPDGGFALGSSSMMNPFTTALALESFLHTANMGRENERVNCANALLHAQRENGSWAGDYILRIPAPYVTDPNEVASWNNAGGGGNSLIEDKDGLFATAMSCYALNCLRNTEIQNKIIS